MYDDIQVRAGDLLRTLTKAGMNRHNGANRQALADLTAAAALARQIADAADAAGAAVPRDWNETEVWHHA